MTVRNLVVSDPLIIKALNTRQTGSIARWADRAAGKMKRYGETIAPVGDILDAGSRNYVVGTYRASFGVRTGDRGNQHQVIRYVYNDAAHAEFVEYGRRPSFGFEKYTWSARGGKWVRSPQGTGGWQGHRVMERVSRLATSLLAQR